jgi:mRNA-degrading endonuclease RelE of RelBE toxin-antitoxin system
VFLRTYRIVYRIRDDAIEVLTVFEGHRRFDTREFPDLNA